MSRLDDYKRTYGYGELIKKHPDMNESGMWQIRGEDPNCDLGGSHHQPDLGVVEGKLGPTILYAVDLPGFWQWGGGGSITKIEVAKLDSVDFKAKQRRQKRIAALREELDQK